MDLVQVEYFVRVAELGSFTRASMMLGVPQPTLSRYVRALETELRHTLLHRNGRGVEVTPAGQCLLDHGRVLLETARRAIGEMDEMRISPRGKVIVGLPSRVAGVLTTPLVSAFRSRFPEAAITVAEGLSSVLHEWLVLGQIEVALLFDPVHNGDLDIELIHSQDLVLVGPNVPNSQQPASISFAQLQDFPLILPRMPNATRAVLAGAASRIGISLAVSVEVDTMATILDLVAGRLGFGVLPAGAIRTNGGNSRFRLSEIHSPIVHNQLFLATYRHRRHTKLASEIKGVLSSINLQGLLG